MAGGSSACGPEGKGGVRENPRVRVWTLATAALLTTSAALADDAPKEVSRGNELYEVGDLDAALERYTRAEQARPDSPVINYNIGNVFYRRGDYERALEEYRRALVSPDETLALHTRFNMGNAHFRSEEYEKAVQDFREVLRQSPQDQDAKRNLELALQALQGQQQPQEQQQQDQGEPPDDQNEQGENQQSRGGQEDEQQQDQQDDPGQDDGSEEPSEEQGEPEGQPGPTHGQPGQEGQDAVPQSGNQEEAPLSVQEAERILNALREEEKENMKRAFRARRSGVGTGKDW